MDIFSQQEIARLTEMVDEEPQDNGFFDWYRNSENATVSNAYAAGFECAMLRQEAVISALRKAIEQFEIEAKRGIL